MKITEMAENRRLVWHCVHSDPEWIGTDVSFDLQERDGGTAVTLRHTDWRAITEFYRFCNYNWAIFLLSLKGYCDDGKGMPFQSRKFLTGGRRRGAFAMGEDRGSSAAASVRTEGSAFQPDPAAIRWRLHFRSPPAAVYAALATGEGRRTFWAESAEEDENGWIRFAVPGGLVSTGRIVERRPSESFATEYFGWTVRFELEPARAGTDLTMTCRGFPPADRVEITAGWVSVLMAMKAAVDFGVDLRNHDPERSWWSGFADN